MNIIYIEPFYSGAHKQWIDSYKEKSSHNIKILSLPGIHWKWRMHGSAISLAKEFLDMDESFDLIIVSDMLNLPIFKSLCQKKIGETKVITYFHENQISYPRSMHDEDEQLNRDLHYAFINYTTALVSDYNLFNSEYHLTNFIDGLSSYLKKMPDKKNLETINNIKEKSNVLHIGCNTIKYKKNDKIVNSSPIILWNHRWEHDKNPEDFFNVLYKIKEKNIDFSLVIVGESFINYPDCFDRAKIKLGNEIIHMGYCDSKKDYCKWLMKSDVIPVTSNQDFFGVSVVEAISSGVYPILPARLAYPEILDYKNNSEIFYSNNTELYNKLYSYLNDYKVLRKSTSKYEDLVNRFDWSNMIEIYDKTFEKYYKN